MNVCVYGLWHLGSVISAGLAKKGYNVTGLDFDPQIVENLRNGKAPIFEPGLDELLLKYQTKKTLNFTCDPAIALKKIDFLWIAFDTPVDHNDNANSGYIEKKFNEIVHLFPNQIKIVMSSQVPVGFTTQMRKQFHEKYPDKAIYISYSPENLRLGKSLEAFLNSDRIIIGVKPDEKSLFFPLFSGISDNLIWMSIESAEMTKHAINSFLATSICFANEIATICENVGADAKEVEIGLKSERRIGPYAYLKPGNAFSGGTLARDIRFLQGLGKTYGLPVPLINSVIRSNNFHKSWIERKCNEIMGEIDGKKITVLGLTYKPGTDTLRRSFSVELCMRLHRKGAQITDIDPIVHKIPKNLQKKITLAPSINDAVESSDCLMVATEWPDFQKIHINDLSTMRTMVVIDPNGFVEQNLGNAPDILYYKIGRDIR